LTTLGGKKNISSTYNKNRDIFIFDGGNKRLRNVTNLYCQCQISQTFVISTEMQQIGNKKVIHRRTRKIICNTFDYMRITFPFEALTKIGRQLLFLVCLQVSEKSGVMKQTVDSRFLFSFYYITQKLRYGSYKLPFCT
jgi:hypothetical protein